MTLSSAQFARDALVSRMLFHLAEARFGYNIQLGRAGVSSSHSWPELSVFGERPGARASWGRGRRGWPHAEDWMRCRGGEWW